MSLFGLGSDKGAKKAAELQKGIMRKWQNLELPTAGELRYDIPEFGAPVQYDPLTGQAMDQEDSLLNNINVDEDVLLDQRTAMDTLDEIVQAGGLTDMDKAALYQIINEQQTAGRGARDALTQEFEQRMGGVAGSGLEAVLKAMANQEAATTGAAQGMDMAAIAQARKIDAADSLGRLSGDVRDQDFDEQSKTALAQDLINQFNVQNRQRVEELNQGILNEGQMYNVGQEQRINEMNTGVAREQAAMEPDIVREQLANEVARLTGEAGGATQTANALIEKDNASNALLGTALQTVGTVGGAIAGGPAGAAAGAKLGGMMSPGQSATYSLPAAEAQRTFTGPDAFQPGADSYWSDINLKENVEPLAANEAEDILAGLSPYKYNYRDPAMGEGERVGPMAQEIEQTAPEMVTDTPGGKQVTYDLNTMGALLGYLNDKIEGRK